MIKLVNWQVAQDMLEEQMLREMVRAGDMLLRGEVKAEVHTRPPFTLSGPDSHKRKTGAMQSHKYPGDDRPKFDPSPCKAAKDCEICLLPCLTALGCRVYVCPYWDRTEQ